MVITSATSKLLRAGADDGRKTTHLMKWRQRKMENEMVKVTEHYGYERLKCVCVYLYPVYNLTKNGKIMVTSFVNDRVRAEQECKRLEILNYECTKIGGDGSG
jgi:hypothetical protein